MSSSSSKRDARTRGRKSIMRRHVPQGVMKAVSWFGALAVAFLWLGCDRAKDQTASGTPSTQPAGAVGSASASTTKVKVGYIGLTCEAPLFTAYEKGFFKEEGVDVEMVKS